MKYIDLYLKGNINSAEIMFDKTVSKFTHQDDMCNLSRLYISRYILNLPKKDKKTLLIATKFSELDNCSAEKSIVNFLSGKPVSPDKLEQPYKAYAEYKTNKNINSIIKIAKDNTLTDYARSRLYRFATKETINTNLKDAEIFLLEANKIDRYNGWTFAIYQDLVLLKEICKKNNKNCSHFDKRMTLLKNILHN